jgi:N-acetylglucosaminyl-diphospho-decaprenol L-rhamnosyltransferase
MNALPAWRGERGKVESGIGEWSARKGLAESRVCGGRNAVQAAVVIPVLNQLAYTQACVNCLQADIAAGVRVVIVDNGSTDGTGDWLKTQRGLVVVSNETNRGCAPAWNQGVRAAADAEWIVILNNDVLLPAGWIAALVSAAARAGLDVASPAMRERDQNYPFSEYAADFMKRMAGVIRRDAAHGVCFAVKREVFAKVGEFDEGFRIGQFEDSDFFRRCRQAGFRLGTVGDCFIHHFGSITQDALRGGPKVRPYEAENRAYYRAKWKIGWWRRRWEKFTSRRRLKKWRDAELAAHGRTLHEKWEDGAWRAF